MLSHREGRVAARLLCRVLNAPVRPGFALDLCIMLYFIRWIREDREDCEDEEQGAFRYTLDALCFRIALVFDKYPHARCVVWPGFGDCFRLASMPRPLFPFEHGIRGNDLNLNNNLIGNPPIQTHPFTHMQAAFSHRQSKHK